MKNQIENVISDVKFFFRTQHLGISTLERILKILFQQLKPIHDI